MNTPELHHSLKPAIAPLRDGEHYRHLFGRAKWYLFISGPAVLLVAAVFVFLVVRPENPELTARALIGLERTAGVPGVKEGGTASLGREDIMMSRTFLRDVAQKLSLQLSTVPYNRDEMFDSVSVDPSVFCGTYRVRFNPQKNSEFLIYYYDTAAIPLPFSGFLPGSNYTIIASGKWDGDLPVHMPGMSLKFSRSLRARPRAFTFHVVDIRVAVEAVYRNLTIKRADPDKGINYIAVLLAGRDYSLAAATANAIADAFIEKNFSFRRSRTRGVVASLDKQLEISQADLASAESKLRDFRSANPRVGLNQQTQQTVSNLAQLDNGIQSVSADVGTAMHLKTTFLEADSSQRLQIARDIAELLSARSVPAGKALQEELARLMTQQHQLNSTYGVEHPLVLENGHALAKTIRSISAALDEFLGNAQTAISMKQQNVKQLSNRLRQLPEQEMQLGELERNRAIYADIYSAVLGSYNQAKVVDAVETTEFYVMDYAVAPLPPPADHSRFLIFCVFIAILSSFGPVLVYDFFDKSVRSQQQLGRITGNVVLEAIPFFSQADETGSIQKMAAHPLINVPCNPVFTREIFDSLLVKIKLRLSESDDRCIVVSGFEGGSGKSTISANLAMAIAMRGHRTLLIDGDLRCGTVKDIFQLPDSGGLAALLAGNNPLTEDDFMNAIVDTKIPGLYPGLYVLPSGREPLNPGALLSSKRMEELRQFCGKHVTYTIIDTPPLGVVSDAAAVQRLFAHYIFVVRSGKTKVADLVNRINEFDRLPEKIIGYVLNGASHDAVGTYRRYSKYYTRTRFLTEEKRKSFIRSPAAVWVTVLLVGFGIAGSILVAHLTKSTGRTLIATAVAGPMPDKSPYRPDQPVIEASSSAPVTVPDRPRSKAAPPRNRSGNPAADLKKEKKVMPGAAAAEVPVAASETAAPEIMGETAAKPSIVDSTESVTATLQKIRDKFTRGDLAGLGSIFAKPALDDGEYYLLMARYLCETGEWRKALPLVEKARTVPARALTGEKMTEEYLFYKAKCLDAAFGPEPTPARGAAAMEAWYDVKNQFRGSPQDSRYLYADNELRRISKEVNGK